MSDCQDMTTALARELTNGIKNEVEDLSAVFKKMAILKPVSDVTETTAVEVDEAPAIGDKTAVIDVAVMSEQSSVDDEISLFVTDEELVIATPVRQARRKKAAAVYENQLSLFDMFDFLDESA